MTPTEQEIVFFKEAKRIQESWEPRIGDWVCDPKDGNRIGILAHPLDGLGVKWQIYWQYAKRLLFGYIETLIFLPRQGQLQAMLKETTGKRFGVLPVELHGEKYWITPFKGSSFERYKKGKSANARGPTPSIALGRALIEVMKGGDAE